MVPQPPVTPSAHADGWLYDDRPRVVVTDCTTSTGGPATNRPVAPRPRRVNRRERRRAAALARRA